TIVEIAKTASFVVALTEGLERSVISVVPFSRAHVVLPGEIRMTQFVPTIAEIILYVGEETRLRALMKDRLKIFYCCRIVRHVVEGSPGAEKSVDLVGSSFNADQPIPTRVAYHPFFIKSSRVARRQPRLLHERHA